MGTAYRFPALSQCLECFPVYPPPFTSSCLHLFPKQSRSTCMSSSMMTAPVFEALIPTKTRQNGSLYVHQERNEEFVRQALQREVQSGRRGGDSKGTATGRSPLVGTRIPLRSHLGGYILDFQKQLSYSGEGSRKNHQRICAESKTWSHLQKDLWCWVSG